MDCTSRVVSHLDLDQPYSPGWLPTWTLTAEKRWDVDVPEWSLGPALLRDMPLCCCGHVLNRCKFTAGAKTHQGKKPPGATLAVLDPSHT